MSSDWTSTTVGELCDHFGAELQTGPFGSQLHSYDYRNEGVPVVPTEAINDGRINPDALPRISFEKARELSRHALKPGDILFARRGAQATGKTALARDCDEGAICGTGAIRLRTSKSTVCDPSFLAACLSAKDTVSWIRHHAIGATMPNLNEGIIRSIPIRLAPVHDQKAIAHILGTLDDKIELNRKTNETLEAIARALFKSWFVDFDPVRAKAEGRPTGLPDAISDLFPDSFEESELGEIPSGWCATQVGECLETVLGGTPSRKRSDYWGGEIPWIGSGMVNEFRVTRPTELITELGLKESATKLLPVRSTLIAITGATLGQVSTNEIELCANQSVVAILPSIELGAEYIYLWTLSSIDILVASQTGGAQQHVNKNNVNELPLLAPSDSVLAHFGATAKPLFDKIAINIFASEFLRDVRDTILPKLISGELRIPDAERLLEEAGV
jgi:type I restriction enzyme S subunit